MNITSIRGPADGTRRWLLEAAQQGDRVAQEQLVRRYEPLVRRVVWQLRPPLGCEREDLAQEARIGLIAAIRAWRPERGPFPAFANQCVRNQALQPIHVAARDKHQVLSRALPFHETYGRSAKPASDRWVSRRDHALAAGDATTDPELRLLVQEQLISVLRTLPTLTPNERLALAGVLAGESHKRLGPILGGTRHAVAQAAYRARRKLAATQPRAA